VEGDGSNARQDGKTASGWPDFEADRRTAREAPRVAFFKGCSRALIYRQHRMDEGKDPFLGLAALAPRLAAAAIIHSGATMSTFVVVFLQFHHFGLLD
jgi:hypothetical protein